MAATTEQKRQSMSGRIATPKPAATSGPADMDAALSKAIGARVRLTTVNQGVTVEGTIFTACPITHMVAISSTANASPSQPCDFHILPMSRIQRLDVLSAAPSSAGTTDNAAHNIARIDLKGVKAREEAAVRRLKEAEAKRGKGVTREGQDIFDALARIYPARWHQQQIVVSDAVMIRAPYRREDCSAPKGQEAALERIRAQVDNVRGRIARAAAAAGTAGSAAPASNNAAANNSAAAGPRKGG